MTATTTPPAIAAVREAEFPTFRENTYINTAAQGLLPSRTVQAITAFATGAQYHDTDRAVPSALPVARERLARLIGANPDDIIFTSNTTHGMNIAIQGIDWKEGDNAVIPAEEFPSLTTAWLHLRKRGVDVRIVPFEGAGATVDQIMAQVDERTRAVSCSAITWNTGWRADLEALGAACAERGVLLIIDGIQAVGVRQLDVKAAKISAMATHTYKWLMASFGVGALYVNPDVVEQIAPTFIGEQAIVTNNGEISWPFTWKAGAARYGAGGNNQIGLAGLAASLGLIEEIGIDTIEAHTTALSTTLYNELASSSNIQIASSPDPDRRSQITVFTFGDRAKDEAFIAACEKQRIALVLRPRGIRVSPHFYNTEEDIARLLELIPR